MDSVGIIGFGRFGRVLGKILSDDFQVRAYDPNPQKEQYGVEFVRQQDILKETTIFVAVPIHAFKNVIRDIAEELNPDTTIIDVCSVKVYPVSVMQEHLAENINIIATHPLFGPDSVDNPEGLRMMMNDVRGINGKYAFWKNYFSSKAIQIIELKPEQHDRLAAETQGITHFVGRVMREAGIKPTEIDTLGFQELTHVIDQTCNDSWDLFMDLQNFNPYTLSVIQKLETAIGTVRGKILRREN